MALTALQLLRRAIDEPTEETYSDAELSERLSSADSPDVAARDIWGEKMSAMASLVNVSEGGSSRSMSQAYDHAKEMWLHYDSLVAKATHAPVLRRIGRV
jgi:hypothetical protein